MEKNSNKADSEVLAEVFRNASLAQQSITDILPSVDDEKIKKELVSQHEQYEKICSKSTLLATELGLETKEPNPIKKAMMWSSIKMNTLTDNSTSHIADMMIQGTVMGITALKTSLSKVENKPNQKIVDIATELLKLEEGFEKDLKEYL